MAGEVVRVEGARQLRATLRRAGADMTDVKALHQRISAVIAGAGRPATPHRTGRLAQTVRAGATQTASVVRAGFARTPYANPIHWGWHRRHITAQPWLSQAAQRTEPTWWDLYADGVEDLLSKIKGA